MPRSTSLRGLPRGLMPPARSCKYAMSAQPDAWFSGFSPRVSRVIQKQRSLLFPFPLTSGCLPVLAVSNENPA